MFVDSVGVGTVAVVWSMSTCLGVGLYALIAVSRTVLLDIEGGCRHIAKIKLFVRVRLQGGRIESVPVKRLIELSRYRKRRWSLEDGWLILEAF